MTQPSSLRYSPRTMRLGPQGAKHPVKHVDIAYRGKRSQTIVFTFDHGASIAPTELEISRLQWYLLEEFLEEETTRWLTRGYWAGR